ncbi:DsrE/DsrF/DrsH-like family protein [Bacillus xiapuensis]|uniref:DsrE/DsrF/DrsH-like family protein n=1 Tax=Bacillus xiapuensis TaxID=2014075 RepID=UPI000C24129B|nr:DsrE/DsrF/DrsH-like family protein [Bacillus xiapuensis]
MKKKVIIIGGAAAGATAAARLRRLDQKAEIILFERGEFVAYASCGLPYYIGEVVQRKEDLLVQSTEGLQKRYRLDIRTFQEVTAIHRQNRTVEVKNVQTGEEYSESYDYVILATGASPVLPDIEGAQKASNIFMLKDIADADRIKKWIDEKAPKEAVVIGGSLSGLEIAENLKKRGIQVTIIESGRQVVKALDEEMAAIIQQHLRGQEIELIVGQALKAFGDKGRKIMLENGETLTSDLTIIASGALAENKLAKQAGLMIGKAGGVQVNEHLQTSDPLIYAIGDAAERDIEKTASLANRHGRAAADHISGKKVSVKAHLGTAAAHVFDLGIAATGKNEKTLKKLGLPFEAVHIHPSTHASYYPGSSPITLKMTFHPETGEVYGAQAIGKQGADKRIDVLAAAIAGGLTVYDLQDLELISSPAFSTPKDPVNLLGYAAGNIADGEILSASVYEAEEAAAAGKMVIDVREAFEREIGYMKGSHSIPLGELTGRLEGLPKDQPLYVLCQVGQRGALAAALLQQNGFEVYNVSGGYKTYAALQREKEAQRRPIKRKKAGEKTIMPQSIKPSEGGIKADRQLNCTGLQCPGPISQVYRTMNLMNTGEILEVTVTDPGFISDVKAWCSKTGNTFLAHASEKASMIVYVQKGHSQDLNMSTQPASAAEPQGATLVVFDQDLDKAIASFIIATGAAAMGKKVTMFFTFWGLNILRREEAVSVEGKDFIEKMFGKMMPRGPKQLPISNMNMGGMGAKMIRSVMEKKNVDSLEKLMAAAMELGVEITACAMSMDVMGIRKEELIEGVQIGGVASYLGKAEESNVNLFI